MQIAIDLETIFRALIVRMQDEGIFEHEAYDDLVDEILEEKLDAGELTTDDDIASMADDLKMRWPEAEAALSTGHDDNILED